MAQFREKCETVEAGQFIISSPGTWPPLCQANVFSSTGYSYDTLEEYCEPDDPAQKMARKGFEIEDRDYIVSCGSKVYPMSETEFNNKFEAV